MYNTIIIDIETLDVKPSAVVLSIGAFAFDRFNLQATKADIKNAESINQFHAKLDIASQVITGRTISEQTQAFWRKNNIQNHFNGKGLNAKEALTALFAFINDYLKDNKEITIYARGIGFDFDILKSLASQYGTPSPICYWQIRDIRSYIDALSGGNNGYLADFKSDINYQKHHALDDAMRDAEMMCFAIIKKVYQFLKVENDAK